MALELIAPSAGMFYAGLKIVGVISLVAALAALGSIVRAALEAPLTLIALIWVFVAQRLVCSIIAAVGARRVPLQDAHWTQHPMALGGFALIFYGAYVFGRLHVMEMVNMTTDHMAPTLKAGDTIAVMKLGGEILPGEMILYRQGRNTVVQRVWGTPDQSVGPKLPADEYIVASDNRRENEGSNRIKRSAIIGVVKSILWTKTPEGFTRSRVTHFM